MMPNLTNAPLPEIVELVVAAMDDWREHGDDWEAALDRLSVVLDAALPLEALLMAPWGTLAEAADGPALRAGLGVVDKLVESIRPDPDRLRERAAQAEAKGHTKIADRRRKRADRLEATGIG